MKVLQTIPGMQAYNGGTTTCTYALLSALSNHTEGVSLLTFGKRNSYEHILGEDEEWMIVLPNDSRLSIGYSTNIKRYLNDIGYDLYHTNGLWMYSNHITCSMARKRHKPYIITPHGMLYPKALHRSYWKKWILLQTWFNKDISKADCIHVTCNQERDYVRQFGYKGPIAVIANPIPIIENTRFLFDKKKERFQHNSRIKFGFLGRLHPRKKVENLLYGASLMKDTHLFDIIIIGEGDKQYEKFLNHEVSRLGLQNVFFVGFVEGEEKFDLLSKLSALFVPSDFENFGMIVTEALSVGTPVMASLGTPWEDINKYECGWWQDCSPKNIAAVMEEIISMQKEDLLTMGERGMCLVRTRYSADQVASQMMQLYNWIINAGEKPEFVYE